MLDLLDAAVQVERDAPRRWLLRQAAEVIRRQQAEIERLRAVHPEGKT